MGILSTAAHAFAGVLEFLLSFLPADPFIGPLAEKIEIFADWLGYINYFIPVGFYEATATAWAACIGLYYIYKFTKASILNK